MAGHDHSRRSLAAIPLRLKNLAPAPRLAERLMAHREGIAAVLASSRYNAYIVDEKAAVVARFFRLQTARTAEDRPRSDHEGCVQGFRTARNVVEPRAGVALLARCDCG
jgi:hypothetical protein